MAAPAVEAPPPVLTAAASSITLPLVQLVEAEAALDALLAERLPAKTAYHVARLSRLVRAETKFFHDQRTTIIRELGVETPPTEAERSAGMTAIVRVKPEHIEAFARRMDELGAVTATIEARPLALDDLTCPMSGADILRLGPLVLAGP